MKEILNEWKKYLAEQEGAYDGEDEREIEPKEEPKLKPKTPEEVRFNEFSENLNRNKQVYRNTLKLFMKEVPILIRFLKDNFKQDSGANYKEWSEATKEGLMRTLQAAANPKSFDKEALEEEIKLFNANLNAIEKYRNKIADEDRDFISPGGVPSNFNKWYSKEHARGLFWDPNHLAGAFLEYAEKKARQ